MISKYRNNIGILIVILFSSIIVRAEANWQIIPSYNISRTYISSSGSFPEGSQATYYFGGRLGHKFTNISINLSFGWRETISRKAINGVLFRNYKGLKFGIGTDYHNNFDKIEIGTGLYLKGCFDKYQYVKQYCFYLCPENIYFIRYYLSNNFGLEHDISLAWNKRVPKEYFSVSSGISIYYKF